MISNLGLRNFPDYLKTPIKVNLGPSSKNKGEIVETCTGYPIKDSSHSPHYEYIYAFRLIWFVTKNILTINVRASNFKGLEKCKLVVIKSNSRQWSL